MGETINLNGEEIDIDAFLAELPDTAAVKAPEQPVAKDDEFTPEERAAIKAFLSKSSQQDNTDEDAVVVQKKSNDDVRSAIDKQNQQLFVMQQKFDNERFMLQNAEKFPGFSVNEDRVLQDYISKGVNPEMSRKTQLAEHIRNVAFIAKMVQEGKYKVEIPASDPVNSKNSMPEDLKDFDPSLLKDKNALRNAFFDKPKEQKAYFEKARRYEAYVRQK